MTVRLVNVDESNWHDCVKLTVAESEKLFVDSNAFTIAEWKFEPENCVKAIYSDSELTGMLAYYYHDGQYGSFYWLYHLMIAPQYQDKGYGQAAVALAVGEIRGLGGTDIVTNCEPTNTRAQYLYKKMGFIHNGTLDGGDIFLKLPAPH